MSRQGVFIVLEGIDGAGTTTQLRHLADALLRRGESVLATRQPSDGPIGVLLRQALTHRLVVPGGGAPSWDTMALLFAADRLDHQQVEIAPSLARGGVVLCDRYTPSSLAYQSVSGGDAESIEWITMLNARAIEPDVVIVLDVDASVAEARRRLRGEAPQLYERLDMQRRLAEFYRLLPQRLPRSHVVVLDGALSEADVHASVLNVCDPFFVGRGHDASV